MKFTNNDYGTADPDDDFLNVQGYFNIDYPTTGQWYMVTENPEMFKVYIAGTDGLVLVDEAHPVDIDPGSIVDFLVKAEDGATGSTYIHMFVELNGAFMNVDSEVRSNYELYISN